MASATKHYGQAWRIAYSRKTIMVPSEYLTGYMEAANYRMEQMGCYDN